MVEFNLSDKIDKFGCKDNQEGYVWADDVKEFIKRLKDWIKVDHIFDENSLLMKIDKLVGDKLI